jgi:hypothetical protein
MPEFNPVALWSAIVVIGGGFIGLVGWVAMRIVSRLDTLTDFLREDIKDLFHLHDKRITKLEAWRDSLASAPSHKGD